MSTPEPRPPPHYASVIFNYTQLPFLLQKIKTSKILVNVTNLSKSFGMYYFAQVCVHADAFSLSSHLLSDGATIRHCHKKFRHMVNCLVCFPRHGVVVATSKLQSIMRKFSIERSTLSRNQQSRMRSQVQHSSQF